MSTSTKEAERIREVEASVLDMAHQGKSLLNRPQAQAVGHLLKLYGSLHRDADSEHFNKLPLTTTKQHFVNFRLALEHCLRWVISECPTSCEKAASFDVLDQEAFELFSWGREYSVLAIDHVTWSRGILDAKIDESSKAIRFSMRHQDHSILIGQATHDLLRGDEFHDTIPQASLERFFKTWRVGFEMGEPPEIPDIDDDQFSTLVDEIMPVSRKLILPELNDSEPLIGFNLGDFRRFYIALHANCWMYSQLETHCDRTFGRENGLGSLILQSDEGELLEYLSVISKLSLSTVRSIVQLLTFDTSFSATLTAQPFVKTNCGSLALLTRLFSHLLPKDILPRSLIRRKSKVYDRLIDKIERTNVIAIKASLRDAGINVKSEVRVCDESDVVTPDLLLYDESANLLVIADYKHSMTPVGPAEVSNRAKDHQKNVEQMKRYMEFFAKSPKTIEPIFGSRATKARIVALLLYRSPMPIPVEADPAVVVADWTTFSRWVPFSHQLAQRTTFNLEEAIEVYVEMSQFSSKNLDWTVETLETKVGEWTYFHERFVAPSATENSVTGSSNG